MVAAAVEEPEGFAALAQSVLAREYVGRTVTFRAEVRTEDVADEAGLHLLGGMPTGPVSLPRSLTVPLTGSTDWTARELSAQVAEHGGMVQFGVFLRGPGRVALRNLRLTFTRRRHLSRVTASLGARGRRNSACHCGLGGSPSSTNRSSTSARKWPRTA